MKLNNFRNINKLYLYYQLVYITEQLKKATHGSIMMHLTKEHFENIEIELPDRKTQDEIVEILSNIDNQTERNNEMVKRLQVLGNTIFSVYFSNCKDYCSLTDFPYIEIIKPGIDKFETQKHYVATAEVNDNVLNFDAPLIIYQGRESRANMQPIKDSVWFAKLKNSVKHIYVSKNDDLLISDYIFSTGFCGLQCDEIAYEFLIGFVELPYFELIKDKLSHGATMESVNNDDLSSIKIPLVSREQLQEYHAKTKDIYEQISMLKVETHKLNKLKQQLLPLLINGQLII